MAPTLVHRELLRYFRRPAEVLNPLVFFLVVMSLFPLGAEPGVENPGPPGAVWAAALLATLMSMDLMFRHDFEEGVIEQLVVSGRPLLLYVASKSVSHWLVSGLPLVLLMPVIALMFHLQAGVLTLALLLVTPTLSLLGCIGAALTAGLARGGLLITLLILPLYTPLLILATAMTRAGAEGASIAGYIYWLAAALLLALALAPLAAAGGLRAAVDR